MNIQILDSWLKEYLETKATPSEIAKYVSLCGPSFERIEKKGRDYIYDIEVTTNRVDSMSVRGIAREAAAILPQFGIKARFKDRKTAKPSDIKNGFKLKLNGNKKLTYRLMGVVIDEIKNWDTPEWMKERLESSGVRSLNAVVDITNYVMLEVGHPAHAFDYDLIKNAVVNVRESKKGEKIVSLENKEYVLNGGDIVFVNNDDEIFDLPGIIGTKNSVVNKNTKRVLYFLDDNDPVRIRKTSMSLDIHTMAATLNEKGVDPELASLAMARGIELYKTVCQAKQVSKIYDLFYTPYKQKIISLNKSFIDKLLGVTISKSEISKLLTALELAPVWKGEELSVKIPSYRERDLVGAEDIVEEIARLYGYYKLPSMLMEGKLPEARVDTSFAFEYEMKSVLKGFGGVEVYTYSLVSQEMTSKNALKLVNPLGKDTEYMRDSLRPSLVAAAQENKGSKDSFHLFELANIYINRENDLPEERLVLAGIFSGYDFYEAKGIIEAFFDSLQIKYSATPLEREVYHKNHSLAYSQNKTQLGEFGLLTEGYLYYEIPFEQLSNSADKHKVYIPAPKYPAQLEDITIKIPEGIYVGEILNGIKHAHKDLKDVELIDKFKKSYTFRISYQSLAKTLTDKDVEAVRAVLIDRLQTKFEVEII